MQFIQNGDGITATGPTSALNSTEEGAVVYDTNLKTLVVCDGTNWIALGGSELREDCNAGDHLEWDGLKWQCNIFQPPTGCLNIGDTCNDGTIYAGLSPNGNIAMYTTPADAASLISWNDGTNAYSDMLMANCADSTPGTSETCRTGEANTAFLVGASSEPDHPFEAAEYCYNLTSHNRGDWYLPAQDELDVLFGNRVAIGGFNTSGTWYWSSSEGSLDFVARGQRFSDGFQGGLTKSSNYKVRCVRR